MNFKNRRSEPMEEKKNQHDDFIENPKEEEITESNDTSLNLEAKTGEESSEENPDPKKDKSIKSKHKKEDRSEELEQQVEQLNDKYLRLYSEFDNYRKRSLKEKIELSKSAAADLIAERNFGKMVSLKNTEIISVPLSEVSGKLKLVEPNNPLVMQAQNMGTNFGF